MSVSRSSKGEHSTSSSDPEGEEPEKNRRTIGDVLESIGSIVAKGVMIVCLGGMAVMVLALSVIVTLVVAGAAVGRGDR